MNSLGSFILVSTSLLIALLHLLSPSSSFNFNPQPPSGSLQGLSGEKTRLGSTPPSCHNKCNQCHPCMAVQVPTIPIHDRVRPGLTQKLSKTSTALPVAYDLGLSPSAGNNKYSNYKPLGWKCRCGDQFYNP